jgi:glycopeptide antibiotics resistance protein
MGVPMFMLDAYIAFALLLLGLVGFGVVRAWLRTPLSGRVAIITLSMWLIALLYMTLRPAGGQMRLNLTPVFFLGYWSPFDTIANMAVFLPLGLILAVAGWRVLPSIAIGFGVSLAIEVTQFILPLGRAADVNDLMTNTAGTALGWFAAWAIMRARAVRPVGRTGTAPPTARS